MLKLHFNEHSKFTIIEKINNASLLKQQRQSLLEQIWDLIKTKSFMTHMRFWDT